MATAVRLVRHPLLHFLLLVVAAAAAYWGTTDGPFVFDDRTSIVENPAVHGLRNFFDGWAGYYHHPRRFFGYLTFAANYELGGLRVTGYHLANLLIHLLSGVMVYLLALRTIRSPSLRESALASGAPIFALFAALFFLLHPVQTQAVTYITQRLASLAALLYLASLASWVRSLEWQGPGEHRARRVAWGFLACVVGLAAAMTKETALTLPLAAAVYGRLFCQRPWRSLLYSLWPLLAGVLIPCLLWSLAATSATSLTGAFHEVRGGYDVSRLHYLLTEPRVILTYLRLLLFPVNQSVDYDYPLQTSFLSIGVIGPLAVVAGLLFLAVSLIRRSYAGADPGERVIAFGILWFFLTLLLESSVIPLDDVIAEHRLYLPLAGLSIGVAAAGGFLMIRWQRLTVVGAVALLFVLGSATWRRNHVWASPVALWADAVVNAPKKARPRYNLGTALNDAGYPDEAARQLREAVRLDPRNGDAWTNLAVAFATLGNDEKAREAYETALWFDPSLPQAHNGLGVLLMKMGHTKEAVASFREAVRVSPDYAEALNNLGAAYGIEGRPDDAIAELERAVRLDPRNDRFRENLRRAYGGKSLRVPNPESRVPNQNLQRAYGGKRGETVPKRKGPDPTQSPVPGSGREGR